MHPQRILSTALKALAERNNLNTAELDDVIAGCGTPSRPSRIGGMRRPSWKMCRWPRSSKSAWWARLATQPRSVPSMISGSASTMSGRWVPPPVCGSLPMNTSPGRSSSAGYASSSACTMPISEPRWMGICSACATMCPEASNSAAVQSRRSLMFGENDALTSVSPISSTIEDRLAPITSTVIGSRSAVTSPPGPCR